MCVTGPIFVLFHTVQCDQSVDAFSFSLSKPFSCVCVPNDDNKNVAYISSLAGLEKVTKKIGSIHHVGWWRLTFVEIHHRNDAGFLSLSKKKKKKKGDFSSSSFYSTATCGDVQQHLPWSSSSHFLFSICISLMLFDNAFSGSSILVFNFFLPLSFTARLFIIMPATFYPAIFHCSFVRSKKKKNLSVYGTCLFSFSLSMHKLCFLFLLPNFPDFLL